MAEEFDLVVLGSGSAASAAPRLAREKGWSVAVVDSRPFGGTCALLPPHGYAVDLDRSGLHDGPVPAGVYEPSEREGVIL